ncbi:N-acetylmuramoyl-L-alanine amidase [Virgibacillus halodenitrificans]|uniref:N-acetylmuramoyl-L-alanine amidase family protein n=1 Tax=Virgibacillus halodenitrificans TaxID=1482 RepID=UPI0024BF7DB8|nr:N-acetylmuramoyl-L-alanine amidase [Virgibacillus halodenitrificans]WHX25819.1 N-acetylmuramoyl-L-alanine amidase [Virgibacillus halodenitrificans]
MKLYLDPGHGGTDPGAVGNGLQEKEIVLDIALRIQKLITTHYIHVEVKMSRTKDSTISLQQRTNEANKWKADFYLSIHCNASNGKGIGYEDFIYSGLSNQSKTKKYQRILHQEISKVNQLTNRGRKTANFHVLRETSMAALLTENGFIDNKADANLMKKSTWRQQVALGHVHGIAKAFQLKRTETKATSPIYRVIGGAFAERTNAEKRLQMLLKAGINDAYIEKV